MSSLLDLLVVRELGIGGAGVRAKPFRRVQLRRTARPLLEAGSPRDHFLTNDLDSVENEQIWAIDKATSADIVPCMIDVSDRGNTRTDGMLTFS
jgi:hypothetical protein